MRVNYFSKDIQEFFVLLDKYDVKYVIVGGEAVIYYGYPRLTGDVDFFYEASPENVKRLYKTLNEFWDQDIPGLNHENELQELGVVFQFGVPPRRIDLINTIENVSFDEAWQNRKIESLKINDKKIQIFYVGREQLIKNKEAMRRYKDLEDLKYLK